MCKEVKPTEITQHIFFCGFQSSAPSPDISIQAKQKDTPIQTVTAEKKERNAHAPGFLIDHTAGSADRGW